MPPKGKNEGGNTSSMTYSPGRRKRMAARRRREEKRWAAKAGPVTVRYMDDFRDSTSTTTEPATGEQDDA